MRSEIFIGCEILGKFRIQYCIFQRFEDFAMGSTAHFARNEACSAPRSSVGSILLAAFKPSQRGRVSPSVRSLSFWWRLDVPKWC